MSATTDWVGAAGSLLAAGTAVIFYVGDKVGAWRRRRKEAGEILNRKTLIVEEAKRLAAVGRGRLTSTISKSKLTGRIGDSEKNDAAAEIGRVMRRLNELKGLAAFEPRLFSQIGQLCDCFLFVDAKDSSNSFALDCQIARDKLDVQLAELDRVLAGAGGPKQMLRDSSSEATARLEHKEGDR